MNCYKSACAVTHLLQGDSGWHPDVLIYSMQRAQSLLSTTVCRSAGLLWVAVPSVHKPNKVAVPGERPYRLVLGVQTGAGHLPRHLRSVGTAVPRPLSLSPPSRCWWFSLSLLTYLPTPPLARVRKEGAHDGGGSFECIHGSGGGAIDEDGARGRRVSGSAQAYGSRNQYHGMKRKKAPTLSCILPPPQNPSPVLQCGRAWATGECFL